jgi:hypothetical protein
MSGSVTPHSGSFVTYHSGSNPNQTNVHIGPPAANLNRVGRRPAFRFDCGGRGRTRRRHRLQASLQRNRRGSGLGLLKRLHLFPEGFELLPVLLFALFDGFLQLPELLLKLSNLVCLICLL